MRNGVIGVLASIMLVGAAHAQLASIVSAGKALSYRVIDNDSGEEISRFQIWQRGDQAHAEIWNQTVFANGDRQLSECIEGDGASKPATAYLSVTVNAAGREVASDFETLNPAYYPFLHRPLPSQPLQLANCFTASGLDMAALARGEEASLYLWINDAIYFRIIFSPPKRQTITVPAGQFDAWEVRVRPDMTTIFPGLPAWAAKMLVVFAPDIRVWVPVSGPPTLLRFTGLELGNHKHTTQELTGFSEAPKLSAGDLQMLEQARTAPQEPASTTENTGTFSVGGSIGRVVMSSHKSTGDEVLAVRTIFANGLAVEGRTELGDTTPPAHYIGQRTYTADGTMVQRKRTMLRADAFPLDAAENVPGDLYPESLSLGLVLPRIRPKDGRAATFHTIGFDGRVNQLEFWYAGDEIRQINGAAEPAAHYRLKPRIDLPIYLKPIAYFLVPTFDLYLQDKPPYRLLDFKGPFGPPGSPDAHFVGDTQQQKTAQRGS